VDDMLFFLKRSNRPTSGVDMISERGMKENDSLMIGGKSPQNILLR